jgi:hypothetical protein
MLLGSNLSFVTSNPAPPPPLSFYCLKFKIFWDVWYQYPVSSTPQLSRYHEYDITAGSYCKQVVSNIYVHIVHTVLYLHCWSSNIHILNGSSMFCYKVIHNFYYITFISQSLHVPWFYSQFRVVPLKAQNRGFAIFCLHQANERSRIELSWQAQNPLFWNFVLGQ